MSKHRKKLLIEDFKKAFVKAFDEFENNNSRKLRNTVELNIPDNIKVTDEDGYTRTIPLSRQTTMGELEKIMDEIEEGDDSSVVNK